MTRVTSIKMTVFDSGEIGMSYRWRVVFEAELYGVIYERFFETPSVDGPTLSKLLEQAIAIFAKEGLPL